MPEQIKDGTGQNNYLVVNDDGSINAIDTVTNCLIPSAWDNVGVTYPDAVTSVFVFKLGGTTVSTITLVNDSQGRLVSAVKS
jgi:hypothetical protein